MIDDFFTLVDDFKIDGLGEDSIGKIVREDSMIFGDE